MYNIWVSENWNDYYVGDKDISKISLEKQREIAEYMWNTYYGDNTSFTTLAFDFWKKIKSEYEDWPAWDDEMTEDIIEDAVYKIWWTLMESTTWWMSTWWVHTINGKTQYDGTWEEYFDELCDFWIEGLDMDKVILWEESTELRERIILRIKRLMPLIIIKKVVDIELNHWENWKI